MALPNSLSTTRISGSSAVSGWPTSETALEQALCDVLGVPINTSITVAAIVRDASGRITNTPEVLGTPTAAVRLRDGTNSKEFRVAQSNGVFTIDENTGSEGTPTWVPRLTINAGSGFSGGGVAYSNILDSSTVSNTAAETAFSKSYSVPAGSLVAGNVVRIRYAVDCSNTSGGTVNFGLRGRLGGSTGQAAITSAVVTNTTTVTIYGSKDFLIRTIGATAVVIPMNEQWNGNGIFSTPNGGGTVIPALSRDTTGALVADVTITMNTASVNATATLRAITVEVLSAGSTS